MHLFNAELEKLSQERAFGKPPIVFAGRTATHAAEFSPNAKVVSIANANEVIELITNKDNQRYIDISKFDRVILWGEGLHDTFSSGNQYDLTGDNALYADAPLFKEIATHIGSDRTLTIIACSTGNDLAPQIALRHNINVYATKDLVTYFKNEKVLYGETLGPYIPIAQFEKFSPPIKNETTPKHK